MPRTKYTRDELKNQFSYSKKILIGVVLAVVCLAEVLFSTTKYQAPNARRVDIELLGGYADTANSAACATYLFNLGQEYEKARDRAAGIDVESSEYSIPLQAVEIFNINYTGDNSSEEDYYSGQKYMVMLAAQEGDIYFLTEDQMMGLVLSGGVLPLNDFIDRGILKPGDRDLDAVTFDEPPIDDETPASGDRYIYALQADTLTGMGTTFSYNVRGKYMVIMAYCQNPDTAATIMQGMIDVFEEAPKGE